MAPFMMLLAPAASAEPIRIGFDDRLGFSCPCGDNMPAPEDFLVNDEYHALGVRFGSGGGGILLASSSNAVSAPNVASPTGPGPVFAYDQPVDASFWLAGAPATVDTVSLTLTDSSTYTTLEAFGVTGTSLGTTVGTYAETLTISFPGSIHSIRLGESYGFAFDDFTFDGLAPEPGTITLVFLGAALITRRRHSAHVITALEAGDPTLFQRALPSD